MGPADRAEALIQDLDPMPLVNLSFPPICCPHLMPVEPP
jgi:hypothetical protein